MRDCRHQFVFALLVTKYLLVFHCISLAQEQIDFQYIYDQNQQLVRVIDSTGTVITYDYDASGNVISVTRSTTAELGPPMVADISPSVVHHGEIEEVVISGTNLLLATITIDVSEVSIIGSLVGDNEVRILFNTSASAPLGLATITLETDLGITSTTVEVKGPLPKVTNVHPIFGTSIGGTEIHLRGTNFTGDTTVTFGGKPVTNQAFVNANTIVATSPAGIPGTAVEIVTTNSNGSVTSPILYSYQTPLTIPGLVAIVTGSSQNFRITLLEPATEGLAVELTSEDPSIASIQNTSTQTIAVGESIVEFVVLGNTAGNTVLTALIGGVSLSSAAFVSPAFSGELEIVSSPVGVFVPHREKNSFSPVVGVFSSPSALPPLLLGQGETKPVSLSLSTPAPTGGLCASIHLGKPSLASVPEEVCIDEGEQSLVFDITYVTSGKTTLTVVAGDERFVFRLISDQIPDERLLAFSPIIGSFIAPIKEGIIASPVGAFVSPGSLPPISLGENETINVALSLASPAPAEGICGSITVGIPSLVSLPQEVCLAEGEQTFSFDITSLASGKTTLTIRAGVDRFVFRLISNTSADERLVAFSGITGAFIASIRKGIFAPQTGVVITPNTDNPIIAPIIGIEVSQ